MIKKFNNIGRITFLVVLSIMILIPTSMGGGVNGNLYLIPIDGTYTIDGSWDDETYVTGLGYFDLNVSNHAPQDDKIVHILYILTAVNMNSSENPTLNVKINGTAIIDWTAADGNNKPTFPTIDEYQYPMTIYKPGTWYNITTIYLNPPLGPRENMTIPIFTAGPSDVKIHFDGAGADEDNVAILTVPSSHDAMSYIPEFSTIALPIAAILGIMFILQSRRRKED